MLGVFEYIPGYESSYLVSTLGVVWSIKKDKALKQHIGTKGYSQVSLYKNCKKRTISVHKLVAITFHKHKPCNMKLVVDHIDGDKLNNRYENLRITTNRFNINRDNKYKGTSWDKRAKMWRARIQVDGKEILLGKSIDRDIAKKLYDKALWKLKE